MHLAIIELTESDVLSYDSYTLDEFSFDGDLPSIFDYVYDVDPDTRKDLYVRFFSDMEVYGAVTDHGKGTILFPKDFKAKFFKEKFETFKEASKELTLEDFGQFGDDYERRLMSQIRTSIDDKFMDHIYYGGVCVTLDYFVRNILVLEQEYFIGGVIGGHV